MFAKRRCSLASLGKPPPGTRDHTRSSEIFVTSRLGAGIRWRCSRTAFASTSIRRSDAKAPLRSRCTYSPASNEKRRYRRCKHTPPQCREPSQQNSLFRNPLLWISAPPIPVAHPPNKKNPAHRPDYFCGGGAVNPITPVLVGKMTPFCCFHTIFHTILGTFRQF